MWDKINFFGWSKKNVSVQPVQRDISITLTNGDRQETIHRSPSGTKMASSSSTNAKRCLDDDESSEGSTSLNFGYKAGTSNRRNSSFSFSREPLDIPTWSNVTSPGFTSRLVQQASGHSPLKEFNDSLSHSPFRKSPYKDLSLGELPFVSFSRRPRNSSPSFPSSNTSFKTGASSSIYNRDRRKHARQGQVFVRIAPLDASIRSNVSITRKSSSPASGPFPPMGSPRAGSEPYRNEGLGGIPQQELNMRLNRMWPHPPGSPVPGPGRPSSPTSPSNIMEALAIGRKRTREQDTFYPPNATPPSMSPPSKISVGIGDTPVRPQMSKRVKFVGGPEGHDRPMIVSYSGIGSDSEPLSSESILEQMNQTEKRFLPDSTSTPYSLQKKPTRVSGAGISDDQSSNLMRKRRSQNNSMSTFEGEPRNEKVSRICTCNDCYAEAAGILPNSPSGSPNKSMSSGSSYEKGTNTGEGKSRETCDKGVSTDSDHGEYFRGIFRNADRFKKLSSEDPEEKDDIMKFGKVIYTREMHDKDKRKRIERYYRMLKLKPEEGSSFGTVADRQSENSNTSISATSFSAGSTTLNGTIVTTASGLTFGKSTQATSQGGFIFGAQTVSTSVCPTSSSSSSGNLLESSGISSTAPTTANVNLGSANPGIANATTSSLSNPSLSDNSATNVNTASPLGQIMFPAGTNTLSKPNLASLSPTTHNAAKSTTTTDTGEGGFNFAGPTTTTSQQPAPSTAAPGGFSFGQSNSAASPGMFKFSQTTNTGVPLGTGANSLQFGQQPVQASLSNPSPAPNSAANLNANSTVEEVMFPSVTNPLAKSKSAGIVPTTNTSATTSGVFSGTTPSTLATPTFGSISTPSASSIFGGGTSTTTSNAGFGSSSFTMSPPQTQNTSTVFGGTTNSQTSASSTASSRGFSFGQLNPTAAAVPTPNAGEAVFQFGQQASTGATPGAGSSSFQFGQQAAQGVPGIANATTSSLSNPSLSDNSATNVNTASPLGQIMFPAGTNTLSKPNLASLSPATHNPAKSTTTTDTGDGGFNFAGPTTTTSQQPAPSTAAPGGFSFGQSNSAASPGMFKFSQTTNTGVPLGTGANSLQFGQQPVQASLSNPSPANNSAANLNANSSVGEVKFPSVTNPLAKSKSAGIVPTTNTSATTSGVFYSGTTPSTLATPTFGSISTPSASSIFGGGTSTTTSNAGFGFGSSSFTMSPPQTQNTSTGFGSNTNSQTSAPSTASSRGFSFGQLNPTAAVVPTPNAGGAVFQFGQQASTGATPGAGSTSFQFGQQAAQGVPGGFNFAAAAPVGGQGLPMFNMGSTSTAPRRRDIRRRHR